MFAQDCAEGRSGGMKLDVYENLRRINRGFELVIEGLAALRKHGAFHRDTLARFAALSKENRSATNSYLTSVIESADRKSTRLNSSHGYISYAVFCLKKKTPA